MSSDALADWFYDKALDLLTRRDHARAELKRKLLNKLTNKTAPDPGSADPELAVEGVLARLSKLHLLDDEKFARQWIHARTRSKPRGPRLLQQELQQKGIDPVLAQRLIAEELKGEDEHEAARRLLERRQHKSRAQNIRYLQSKGFSFDVINAVL